LKKTELVEYYPNICMLEQFKYV